MILETEQALLGEVSDRSRHAIEFVFVLHPVRAHTCVGELTAINVRDRHSVDAHPHLTALATNLHLIPFAARPRHILRRRDEIIDRTEIMLASSVTTHNLNFEPGMNGIPRIFDADEDTRDCNVRLPT